MSIELSKYLENCSSLIVWWIFSYIAWIISISSTIVMHLVFKSTLGLLISCFVMIFIVALNTVQTVSNIKICNKYLSSKEGAHPYDEINRRVWKLKICSIVSLILGITVISKLVSYIFFFIIFSDLKRIVSWRNPGNLISYKESQK